jgi:hypothetical protein
MTVFTAVPPAVMTAGGFNGLFQLIIGYSHNSDITVAPRTANELKLSSHTFAMDFDFVGSSFTYSGKTPTGGTLHALYIDEGSVAYSFTNMSVPIATLIKDVNTLKFGAVLNLLFGHNDVIRGSVAGDYLNGLAGNDHINGGVGNDHETGGAGGRRRPRRPRPVRESRSREEPFAYRRRSSPCHCLRCQ